MDAKKKNKKPASVKKPFLTGSPVDQSTVKSALVTLGMLVVMMILFLLAGAVFMFENTLLRYALNAVVLFTCYLMFYYYGMSAGTQAVNHGEIMYVRRESGRTVEPYELVRAYHPLKGLIGALLGALPLFLCALTLACIAHRQTMTIGVLPSWTVGLADRAEFGDAVAFYSASTVMSAEDVLRIIVRMSCMPWVNIFGPENSFAMLTMERISPILVMLPALAYGLGYTQGPRARARIHGDIEAGKRKHARKLRKQKKAGITAQKKAPKGPRGPEQLN